jgi:hypothetical protein
VKTSSFFRTIGVSGFLLVVLLLGIGAMGLADDGIAAFPCRIAPSATQGGVMELRPGYVALHGEPLPREMALLVFEPEAIAVLPAPLSFPLAPTQSLGPVYGPPQGDALAVPTGRIFIRFQPGESAAAHRSAIEQAGYAIAAAPDYAPEAAWLVARSGSLAEALAGVFRLAAVPGVASVEPQLLMQRVSKELRG